MAGVLVVSTAAYTSASKVMTLGRISQFSNQVVARPPRESVRVSNPVACKIVRQELENQKSSCGKKSQTCHQKRKFFLLLLFEGSIDWRGIVLSSNRRG